MSQKYCLDVVSEAELLGCKSSPTPLEQHHRLGRSASPFLADPTRDRRLVGRLVYLAVTRPNLTCAVHILSQIMQTPYVYYWDAAVRTVQYLKGTPGQGIFFSSKAELSLSLSAWCDSDYAGCPNSRRSSTGWMVLFGGSLVSWKTKKQPSVSLSFSEAEYRAM